MTISQIVSKTYFYTKTNVTSFPAADMLILINTAYDRVVSLIIKSDNRWQWDDTNQPTTDQGDGTGGLPTATTALVSGQQDYTFATTLLEVTRVELKDTSGNWRLLTPIDQNDVPIALGQYNKTAGIPTQYDKLGNSIFLYPPSNFSQAASLKVCFTRGPVYFTSAEVTTGTKSPGFNSLYHDLIPLWASFDYALTNGLPNANLLKAVIDEKEGQLQEEYNKRSKDQPKYLRAIRRSSQ